jgi:hypothetical protein
MALNGVPPCPVLTNAVSVMNLSGVTTSAEALEHISEIQQYVAKLAPLRWLVNGAYYPPANPWE